MEVFGFNIGEFLMDIITKVLCWIEGVFEDILL